MMKKILIISYEFPPVENIASGRFGSMVEYLPEYGYEPLVLTSESEGTLPVVLEDDRIFRVGTQRQKTARIDTDKNAFKIPKPLEWLKNKMPGISDLRLRSYDRSMFSWHKQVMNEIDDYLPLLSDVKLIIASFSPAAALWIGRYLSKKLNIPWIADFRDLGALRHDDRNVLARLFDRKLEKFLLSSCSGIISVSQYLVDILRLLYSKPTEAVYNGWAGSVIEQPQSEPDSLEQKNYLFYAGRFYPHRMESVRQLLLTLQLFPNLKLRLRSLGPPDLEFKIKEWASKYYVANQVEILEPCASLQIALESGKAFINLVFEDLDYNNDWSRGTLTGKFLELLPYIPPVLSIVRRDNEMGSILRQTNKGRLCSNSSQIELFLRDVEKQPTSYSGVKKEINRFSKKEQARKLSRFVDDILVNNK